MNTVRRRVLRVPTIQSVELTADVFVTTLLVHTTPRVHTQDMPSMEVERWMMPAALLRHLKQNQNIGLQ